MSNRSIWELLWDYDPNGLVVVDKEMNVVVVNPSFCKFFKVAPDEIVGKPLGKLLGDISGFKHVYETGKDILGEIKHYPAYGISVRQIIFKVKEKDLVGGIFVDVTAEEKRKEELSEIKKEATRRVHEVINQQMEAAQKIAGLLGETTARTKALLLKIESLLQEEGQ